MSRKTRKNHPSAAASDDDRHLHAVPGQQNSPTTDDKVRAALAAKPGSTAAALAMAAGVGRSTAAKALARWGRDGTAIRTAGDSTRQPDTWTLAPSGSTSHDTAETAPTQHATPAEVPGDAAPDDVTDPATVSGANAAEHASSAPGRTDSDSDTATTPPGSAPSAAAERMTDDRAEPRENVPPACTNSPAVATADKTRLPKGGLRALVEEYLTNHPNDSFGPAEIGKDLCRSGGAVNNALEKLVSDGYAIKTCEAPKRFAINRDKTDIPAIADGTA